VRDALKPGKKKITDGKPRRLRGRQDAVDVVNQLFLAIINDVVCGHFKTSFLWLCQGGNHELGIG
jgi:hypothetical protein